MNVPNQNKRLIRPRSGRMVAGVCVGLAEYLGIDATIIRLVFLALTLFTAGVGALVYLAGWVVIPEEGEDVSIAEKLLKKTGGS